MDVSIVVGLGEHFERHIQLPAIMEQALMMKRNSPGPRIKIKAFVELHLLGCAPQLRISIATVKRPISSPGAIVVFEHLYLVTSFPQLISRCHSCDPSAQHQNRSTLYVTGKLDGPTEIRLSRVAHRQHSVIHRSTSGDGAD